MRNCLTYLTTRQQNFYKLSIQVVGGRFVESRTTIVLKKKKKRLNFSPFSFQPINISTQKCLPTTTISYGKLTIDITACIQDVKNKLEIFYTQSDYYSCRYYYGNRNKKIIMQPYGSTVLSVAASVLGGSTDRHAPTAPILFSPPLPPWRPSSPVVNVSSYRRNQT